MKTWKDNLDARIDRCDCGSWRWDGRCPVCDPPLKQAARRAS